jgi:hypothetical protein
MRLAQPRHALLKPTQPPAAHHQRRPHPLRRPLPAAQQPGKQVLKLVWDMLRPESLPPGWASAFDAAAGNWAYTHAPSGAQREAHPILDYYIGAIFMDRGGYRQLLENLAARPPAQGEVRRAWGQARRKAAGGCGHAPDAICSSLLRAFLHM